MHGTNVLSLLADPVWGWAPKARFLTYAQSSISFPAKGCEGDQDDMIHRAINDGADIINISGDVAANPWTLVRAALRGIPIVVASGNGAESQIASPWNILVSVGATDMSGTRSAYSQYGQGLTVTAPGNPIICRDPDSNGELTIINRNCTGTSLAAPMVTGALALAMQAWPQADGNQLIASLIDTATTASGGWEAEYGWGWFNPQALIDNDPSRYSTESPLREAFPGKPPTDQDFLDYQNGTIHGLYGSINSHDNDYTPATTPGSSGGLPLVGIIVGGIVLIGLLVIVIVLVTRRPRTPTAPTGYPPQTAWMAQPGAPRQPGPPGPPVQPGQPRPPGPGWR